jgi:hypothetical protein
VDPEDVESDFVEDETDVAQDSSATKMIARMVGAHSEWARIELPRCYFNVENLNRVEVSSELFMTTRTESTRLKFELPKLPPLERSV